MSLYKIPEFREFLFLITFIAIFGGVPALISLFNALPVAFGIILQALPFFKWDLVILGLKLIWGVL
jgi:hypothetical protein